MKMGYIAGIYGILLLLLMSVFWLQISEKKSTSIDMLYYNDEQKKIAQALEAGNSRESVEREHQCRILKRSDQDYESKLNQSFRTGSLVLDYPAEGRVTGKIIWQREQDAYFRLRDNMAREMVFLCLAVLAAGWGFMLWIHIKFIRPFRKLQKFSSEVAKGNLDLPLPMNRHNFFGAFSESFDLMREELKTAKAQEYQANVSKKELVAELSHDIKTPVAAIKAVCEVMQVKEKNPDTLERLDIIAAKAGMIDQLIGNLFHATLEELEVLKVEAAEESSRCILSMLEDLKGYGTVIIENEVPACLVYMDVLRFRQVLNNIVYNSYKYAKTEVCISFREDEAGIRIIIKDRGPGIPEEEIPFVTEKYYRGSNASGISGSGLGLYLARSFMEQMRGGMEYYNQDGFVVTLYLGKAGRDLSGGHRGQ